MAMEVTSLMYPPVWYSPRKATAKLMVLLDKQKGSQLLLVVGLER